MSNTPTVPVMMRHLARQEKHLDDELSISFQKLLDQYGNKSCRNSEFIELNKIRVVEIGPMDENDYYYFWGCMELFDKLGINYFAYYSDLKKGLYGDFSNGIEQWFRQNLFSHDEKSLKELLVILKFFGMDYYQEIPISEFETALNQQSLGKRITQKTYNNSVTEQRIKETRRDKNEKHKAAEKSKQNNREINLKLRWNVLKRDNYRCCKCGASPATDPLVQLHVDHIIPRSKGGENTIENLQTLCSKCNLGKGDLI